MFTFYTQDHLTYSRLTPTPSHSDHSPSFALHNIAHPNLPPIRSTIRDQFQIKANKRLPWVPDSPKEENFFFWESLVPRVTNDQPPPHLHILYLTTSSESIHFGSLGVRNIWCLIRDAECD